MDKKKRKVPFIVSLLVLIFAASAGATSTPYYTAKQASFLEWQEAASYESDFGLYSVADPSKRFEIFSYNNEPGATRDITVADWVYLDQGFGFYFAVHTGGKTDSTADYLWFSDSKLNQYASGVSVDTSVEHVITDYISPHLVTVSLEDLLGGGDKDYNDMTVTGFSCKLDQVAPVPEPVTAMLFGTGIIGLAGVARRRNKA